MASSLSEECTPLKQEYDACFNSWFEGYLEPLTNGKDAAAREKHTRAKAEEYERNCGKVWKSYRDCVQKAVVEKDLDKLLQQARDENPLNEPIKPSDDEANKK